MLCIGARAGDVVVLEMPDGRLIEVRLLRPRGSGSVRLGITAPGDVGIYRGDVWQRVQLDRAAVDGKTGRPGRLARSSGDEGWEECRGGLYRCQVYVLVEEDGRHLAIAARLLGIANYGRTEQEALWRVTEALAAAIAGYVLYGRKVPWLGTPREPPPDSETRWVLVQV